MMTNETLARILSLLEGKFLMRSWRWKEEVADLYALGLRDLPDELAMEAVVGLLTTQEKPPDVGEIALKAAEIASPYPYPEDAWDEVFKKMGYAAPAALSHSLVRQAAFDLGGLNTLWHQYRFANTPLSILRKQFLEAYQARAERWRQAVAAEIRKPESAWAKELFPGRELPALAAGEAGS